MKPQKCETVIFICLCCLDLYLTGLDSKTDTVQCVLSQPSYLEYLRGSVEASGMYSHA